MRWLEHVACDGRRQEEYVGFDGGNMKEESDLELVGIDRGILLQLILKIQDGRLAVRLRNQCQTLVNTVMDHWFL